MWYYKKNVGMSVLRIEIVHFNSSIDGDLEVCLLREFWKRNLDLFDLKSIVCHYNEARRQKTSK